MGGRLSLFATSWTQLTPSYWLNNIIQKGFQIPFTRPPPLSTKIWPTISRSADQEQLLQQEISELLEKQAIEPAPKDTPGFMSPLFVIPKRNGGHRPVFNLRRLNQYIKPNHFKMETLSEVCRIMRPNDFMTSLDLADAFLHLPIHPDHRKYLRFQWKQQTYQFTTTPFGLSIVPWLFTKVTRPILQWARQQGIRVSAYLDDWILLGESYEICRQHTNMLIEKLNSLGWIINAEEVQSSPQTDAGTPGIRNRHCYNDDEAPWPKGSRSEAVHSTTSGTPVSYTQTNPQCYDEDTSRNIRSFPGETVHPAPDQVQERTRSTEQGLGYYAASKPPLPSGAPLVGQKPSSLERSIPSSTEGQACTLCRCEQHRLGLCPGEVNRTWILEPSRSTAIYQLARAESSPTGIANLPPDDEHHSHDQNRQYDSTGSHQQTRRDAVASTYEPGNKDLALVPATWAELASEAHCWQEQHDRRSGVAPNVHQKLMEDFPISISRNPAPVGPTLSGPVRGPHNQITPELHIMDAGPASDSHRRALGPMDQHAEPILEPTVEPGEPLSTQDLARGRHSNHDRADLGECLMVPDPPQDGNGTTNDTAPPGHCPSITENPLATEERDLEAWRLQTLKRRFEDSGLSDESINLFMDGQLENTLSNRIYQRGQHLFISWAFDNDVSLTEFTTDDLINFLVYSHSRGYSLSTIKSQRTAVLKLHISPQLFHGHDDLTKLFARLANLAPPIRQTKQRVDLSNTIRHLQSIKSSADTRLAALSMKTAFLLAMVAFLRPSDLHRIYLPSATVDSISGALTFDFHAPKERRHGQRIIKTVAVQPHTSTTLCPVVAFCALRDHPRAASRPPERLFVNAKKPSMPVESPQFRRGYVG